MTEERFPQLNVNLDAIKDNAKVLCDMLGRSFPGSGFKDLGKIKRVGKGAGFVYIIPITRFSVD